MIFRGALRGDPPPSAPVGRTWRLWEHEVLEFFLAGADDSYLELEVGPHGHYLALHLSAVRQIANGQVPVQVSWQRLTPGRWQATAMIAAADLPPPPWRVNAFEINGQGEDRRYLAAHPLPGDAPDFHQPARFLAWDL